MATPDTTRPFAAFVDEGATPGTRVDLTYPTDNNIKIHMTGQPTIDVPVNPVGDLASGKHTEGKGYSGKRSITLPDMIIEFLHSGDKTVAPLCWKIFNACGMFTEDTGTEKQLVWDGLVPCNALSGDMMLPLCGTAPDAYGHKLRGGVGSITIGADGPNEAIKATVSGFMGAYLGRAKFAAQNIEYGTIDTTTADKMGVYVLTLGAQVYTASSWSFSVNCTITDEDGNNPEGITRKKITGMEARFEAIVNELDPTTDDLQGKLMEDTTTSGATIASTDPNSNWDIAFGLLDPRDAQMTDIAGTSGQQLTFYPESATFKQK